MKIVCVFAVVAYCDCYLGHLFVLVLVVVVAVMLLMLPR